MFGTLSLSDLLATTSQQIAQLGPNAEAMIWDVFQRSLEAHNRILAEETGEFVERTTERLIGAGGVSSMVMQDLDEFGTPHVQKVTAGENLGFPLNLTGNALQWTRTYLLNATPADVAAQFVAAQDADRNRLIRDIKRAIHLPTNTSFVDYRMKDRPTLPVKALANADSFSIPVGPNGESFDASTHTHYLGTSSFVAADLTALINTVIEHYNSGEIRVIINTAQEAAVRAFSGFAQIIDARLVLPFPTSLTYATGALNVNELYNRRIGIFAGAEIWVKPWAVPGYVVAYNRSAPKILAMRVRAGNEAMGDFHLAFEDEDHPLRARGYEREFGIGVKNRVGAAVLDTGHASYTAPTIN